nr:hypothetical protein CFP56_62211 [Quercus suber]
MAFGGAGYALSYPLAEALAKNLDVCIKTYPTLYGSDHIIQSCVADLGVSLSQENGFHQIDLHGDISGFLSALPQSPTVSLHHLDQVEPIFPSMNRYQSLNHLMEAAKADQPLKTFVQWKKSARPPYIFNTQFPSNDPCEAPHVFYFETVEKLITGNQIVTSYVRKSPQRAVIEESAATFCMWLTTTSPRSSLGLA